MVLVQFWVNEMLWFKVMAPFSYAKISQFVNCLPVSSEPCDLSEKRWKYQRRKENDRQNQIKESYCKCMHFNRERTRGCGWGWGKRTCCEEAKYCIWQRLKRPEEQNQIVWEENTVCDTLKRADTSVVKESKCYISDPLWIWSISQIDCNTFSLTVSHGRFFKLPPGHPAVSKAFQRAFSLAFDSPALLFSLFSSSLSSLSCRGTLATERERWRSPHLFSVRGARRKRRRNEIEEESRQRRQAGEGNERIRMGKGARREEQRN